MTPTLLVLPKGAYTNQTNAWVFIYGTDTCTMTDASGQTLDIQSLPTWLPPGATITPSQTGDRLIALMADNIEDFRGFLSRPQGILAGVHGDVFKWTFPGFSDASSNHPEGAEAWSHT